MNDAAGAQFTTSFFSTDTIDPVNFRFHYSDNTSGGWSGTVIGTPTPFAKTMTTASLTPALTMVLSTDHSTAVPGDTITYTATVSNTGSTLAVGGDFLASATGSSTATVKSYWDDVSTSIDGSTWTVLGGAAATASGYTPAASPPSSSGMSLAATSVAASGVTYPSSGDPILGTTIPSGGTAQWHYTASLNISASQAAALFDPTKVKRLRNSFHLEVAPANPNVSQTAVINLDFSNLFYGGGASASLSNVKVTIQPPGATAPLQFNSTTTPALATLASGASASVQGAFVVPAAPAKASGQTDAAYFATLSGLEGSILKATGSATATAVTGTVNASSPAPVTTMEHLPIVSITKSGPANVTPGSTETNPLALTNSGGATASTLGVSDSVAGGGSGTVTGVPATLAPGASASATATFPVPAGQAPGALTDVASLTWQDANFDPYGPVSSSFTTTVTNPFAGATLTLVPTAAGPNAPGITQTLTATLLDANKQPLANQPISFVISGANPKSGTAVTDANGNATFSYVGFNEGTDTAKATFTAPGTTIASNPTTITWLQALQPVATTLVTGNFFRNDSGVCHFGVGPGSTPAFSQQFPNIMFNPDPAIFKFPPPFIRPDNNGTVFNISTRPFTDITTDVNGNPNGAIVAQGNGFRAGDGGTPLEDFFASFTGSFVINQPGDVTFRILHDDGYILGVGGGASRVSGDFDGDTVPTTTSFNGYPTMAAWNTSSTGSSNSGPATIHFPNPGLYPFEIDYTECQGGPLYLNLLTEKFNPQTSPLSIYVGYADGLRPAGSVFPFPWAGSPNVTFEGCAPPCQFDGGTIRIDNSGSSPAQIDSVTVDIPFATGVNDCPGVTHFDIWPHNLTIPAGQILVLAAEAPGTTCSGAAPFDTSDTSFYCGPDTGVIPVVNVTSGGVTTSFNDTTQVLNTGGRDQADCGGNESISWSRVGGGGTAVNLPLPPAAQLTLTPFSVPGAIQGQSLTETVSALDGAGNPVASLPVTLSVFGPNAVTQTASTGTDGLVTFTYNGNLAGTDTLQATASIQGLQSVSNTGTVVWTPTGGTNNPLGPSITGPTPADGSVITKPTAVDATIAPPSGHTIAGWRVFDQAVVGGPLNVIGSGTGAPPSPLGVMFDPTLLADGTYRLTVEATADDGAIQDVVSGVSVIGGLKLGRYTTSFQDLAVPVDGFTMQVQRSYDSTDASSGDFGVGWRLSVANFRVSSNHTLGAGGWTQFNSSCVFGLCFTAFKNSAPRLVTVVFPNGHSEVFDFSPTGGTNLFWECHPQFTARGALGTTSTLVPLDDTACTYQGDGNLYGSNGAYNPQRFLLTTRSGMRLVLDQKLGLISMTDRNGNSLTIDGSGIHSSSGPSIVFARDSSGRITQIIGPAGQTVSYNYSTSGDLASSTDPIGDVDTYTYDAAHRLLTVTGPQGALSTETYGPDGRLSSITNANGQTTRIQDSTSAKTMTITDATGAAITVLTSDDLGDIVRADVTAGGTTLTTRFTYDSVGHVTQKVDGLGHVESAVYDSAGDLVKYTDPLGNATTLTYDGNGNLTSMVAPDGSTIEAVNYDSNGNPVSKLGPGGSVVNFAYDSAGRTTSRADALGNTISYAYNTGGHLTQLTDPSGKATTFTYDAGGRVASETDSLGNTISFSYDAANNVVRTVDALGATQTFTYDSLGLMTSATDPLGRTTTSTYDADGNVTSVKDRDGNTTSYTYDADGRLTRIDYPGGEFIAFSLDGFGRPTTLSNSSSTINNAYDADGHLLTSTTTASVFGSVSFSYTYDAAGNRLSSTGPDGTVSYAYDLAGRAVKVTDNHGGVFGVQYDSAGRIVGLTRPNGVTDSYTYSSAGRLVAASSSRNGTVIQSFGQTLNANSQIATLTDASGTATYTHDADGRLVAVSRPSSVTQSYAYDAVGNRTSGPESPASTYNLADQRLSDSNFTYAYDNEGDRITRTDKISGLTTHYVYNGHHQLTEIQYPDGTSTSYTYDALGRRIGVASGAATTAYVYDGVDARLEYSSGSLVASYVSSGQVDRPLEMTRNGTQYYYLQDLQGSVSNLTDSTGSIAASYSYDAFGVPTSAPAAVTNPFTYTGREYDAKSGLYYDRARYYDASTGSMTSPDPVPAGPTYAYAGNDPVDFIDPSGAFLAEVAERYQQVANSIKKIKAIGCTTSLLGAFVEVGLDSISPHPASWTDLKSILAGVGVGCAFGALTGAPDAFQLIIFPLITAIAAGLVDYWLQANCGGAARVDWTHVLFAVAGALLVSTGSAILTSFLPATAQATLQLGLGFGTALLSGDLSSLLDNISPKGACP
ncbi:MAG TPA: RHS repeat-associated core domain-containing protein [Candidatus Dormibacteraeota bacterium]|nr:RHS repeat-associated core domain-containing protein [Candidatus Dormibacteraeota bacterium]